MPHCVLYCIISMTAIITQSHSIEFVLQWSSLCLRILHIRGVKSSSEGNVYIRNLDGVVFILKRRVLQPAVKWWQSMRWYFAFSGTWSQGMILSHLRWVTEEVVFLWGKLTDSSTTCIQLHPGLVLRCPEQCPCNSGKTLVLPGFEASLCNMKIYIYNFTVLKELVCTLGGETWNNLKLRCWTGCEWIY